MIEAKIPGFDRLAARLTVRARVLAEAWTRRRALARRGDSSRWRQASLLWPLFSKG